eukprot:scaffold288066_cov30-Tisochrysis_lutea.AAC.1
MRSAHQSRHRQDRHVFGPEQPHSASCKWRLPRQSDHGCAGIPVHDGMVKYMIEGEGSNCLLRMRARLMAQKSLKT